MKFTYIKFLIKEPKVNTNFDINNIDISIYEFNNTKLLIPVTLKSISINYLVNDFSYNTFYDGKLYFIKGNYIITEY